MGSPELHTGVQDVQALVWKLAATPRSSPYGVESQRLHAWLDTYEQERKPIGQHGASHMLRLLQIALIAQEESAWHRLTVSARPAL